MQILFFINHNIQWHIIPLRQDSKVKMRIYGIKNSDCPDYDVNQDSNIVHILSRHIADVTIDAENAK